MALTLSEGLSFRSAEQSLYRAAHHTVAFLQVNQLLELESEQSMNTQKYTALDKWAKHLGATHQAILNKMA